MKNNLHITTFCTEFHPDFPAKEQRDIDGKIEAMGLTKNSETPDIVFAFGGDGTLLRAARNFASRGSFLCGVKFGGRAFLAGLDRENWQEGIMHMLDQKNYVVSLRIMLEGEHDALRGNALNDFVIHRGAVNKALAVEVRIDGTTTYIFRGDGVIISTPTGSTAYNRASGGPVVSPEENSILVTPISPIDTDLKSLVVSGDSTFEIKTLSGFAPMVSYDSESVNIDLDGSALHVRRAPYNAKLIYPKQ